MKAVTNFMGWAALVGGAVLGILSLLGGEVVLLVVWIVLGLVLAVILFGLTEVLERLEDQQALLLEWRRSQEKPGEKPATCQKCGTPLPPGGSTCPTSHHYNSRDRGRWGAKSPLRAAFLSSFEINF